jgi:Uma2 family endonuclease
MITRPDPVFLVSDLDLMPDDTNRYEVIDGELFVSKAPSVDHQIVSSNLNADFAIYLRENPIGKVIPAPGVIFSEIDGVIPDLVYVSNETLERILTGQRLTGAPDLIVEILSPGPDNQRRDRIAKMHLYGKFGVREYWLIDFQNRLVEINILDGQVLRRTATLSDQDELTSTLLPGFRCRLSSIFAI